MTRHCFVLVLRHLWWLCWVLGSVAWADPGRLIVDEVRGEYRLGRHLLILEDHSGTMTIDEVASPAMASRFAPSAVAVPTFGFNPHAYWARLVLQAQVTQQDVWFLELAYPPMQWVDVYTRSGDGAFVRQRGGTAVPSDERPFAHHSHVFKLRLAPGERVELFVRIAGESSKSIPLVLRRSDAFAHFVSMELLVLGTYFGIIIGLVLYNLFIFASVRETSFVWYILFLSVFCLAALTLHGIAPQYLWPEHPEWTLRAIPLFIAIAVLAAAKFAMEFIQTRALAAWAHYALIGCVVICACIAVLSFFTGYRLAILSAASIAVICPIVFVMVGIYALMKNNEAARYYLLAWFFLLLGSFVTGLRAFGLAESNFWTDYGVYIGSSAEAVLLAIALAARVRALREQKEQAQQSLLTTLQQQSDLLEDQVAARTHELMQTQRELVVKDRLASMAVLTSGVTQELQSPHTLIRAGLQNLSADVREFSAGVSADWATLPPAITDNIRQRITSMSGQLSLVDEGSRRIGAIIDGLRTLTEIEGESQVEADVMESLEQAMTALKPAFVQDVDIMLDYSSRPRMQCWPGELTQVFAAVILNACQAVVDNRAARGGAKGAVRISAHVKGRDFWVTVEDNGAGMSDDVLGRAFDPFYTTRAVGEGAGLGLTLARELVIKHGGKVQLMSELGSGTVVRIILPVVAA